MHPRDLENQQNRAPIRSWYEISNRAGAVARIDILEEIGVFGVSANDFIRDLRDVSAPLIKLQINSPGGSVDDGIAIYNSLKAHPATVEVHNLAMAASIASVVAMAGDRVVMAPHSRMMVHEAMTIGLGFASDFEKTARRLRDATRNIADIYAERTGKPAAYWLEKMAEETWFNDQAAVNEGLADEVGRDHDSNNFRLAANFNLSKYRNAPDLAAALPPGDARMPLESATLDGVHAAFASLQAVHNDVCALGEECPLRAVTETETPPAPAEDKPAEPEPPAEDPEEDDEEDSDDASGPSLARRELEAAIARVRL